jgi:hypothetical protein
MNYPSIYQTINRPLLVNKLAIGFIAILFPLMSYAMLRFITTRDVRGEFASTVLISSLVLTVLTLSTVNELVRNQGESSLLLEFLRFYSFISAFIIVVFMMATRLYTYQATSAALIDQSRDNFYIKIGVVIFLITFVQYVLTNILATVSSNRFEPESVATSNEVSLGKHAYALAAKEILVPLIAASLVTLLTYLFSSYQNSVVNHATIFGVYLTIFILIDEKAKSYKIVRNSNHK